MYLENYSVRVFKEDRSPAAETNGYVSLVNGEKYKIRLRNQSFKECFCDLKIDGKSIGKFYIRANESVDIERPENDSGRLTFYTVDSKEGQELQLSTEISKSDLGLIDAEFVPIEPKPIQVRTNMTLYKANVKHFGSRDDLSSNSFFDASQEIDHAPFERQRAIPTSAKVGGTGLSGESDVQYKDISISPDRFLHNEAIKIRLRLIGVDSYSTVRKLVSSKIKETPIPAPL